MRIATKLSKYEKMWHLLNDTELKTFKDLYEVIEYLIESGACPTVIIYEKLQLAKPVSFEETKKIDTVLNEEQLLMLTCLAKDKDDNINDFAKNEEAMKQQAEIMKQIELAKSQQLPQPKPLFFNM